MKVRRATNSSWSSIPRLAGLSGHTLKRELQRPATSQDGSLLIIVLWIAFGLVAITLYFANSMNLELRASDNRVSALTADQAIEGAARYVNYLLASQISLGSNGVVPDITTYGSQAMPVGDAHFWFIGRDVSGQTTRGQVVFGLVDEASKLNLNTATADMLQNLPNMTAEFAAAIVDWRDTDDTASASGAESQTYALQRPPYLCKNANFETVDELRLVYGADMSLLVGEDANRNGALDSNETDDNSSGTLDSGIADYVTVYSREPNAGRTNVNTATQKELSSLLGNAGVTNATQIYSSIHPGGSRVGNCTSALDFYIRSGLKAEQFAQIETSITTTNGPYIEGRVNVSTASAAVLACVPGISSDNAQNLVNYRLSNPDKLNSVAWVTSVLGRGGSATRIGRYITTQSYQFSADVAAIGPFGRGYRRTRFVFDTSEGTPKIIYRQDLSHLGWALGKEARQIWLMADNSK